MSDLIDRQAAIDEIKAVYEWHDYITMERLIEHIRKLPSAQPYTEADIQKMQDLEQAELDKAFELGKEEGRKEAQPEQRWIPCSERLPEKDGCYLTTTCYRQVYADYWNEDHFDRTEAVIAWCELPEPYREEGTE